MRVSARGRTHSQDYRQQTTDNRDTDTQQTTRLVKHTERYGTSTSTGSVPHVLKLRLMGPRNSRKQEEAGSVTWTSGNSLGYFSGYRPRKIVSETWSKGSSLQAHNKRRWSRPPSLREALRKRNAHLKFWTHKCFSSQNSHSSASDGKNTTSRVYGMWPAEQRGATRTGPMHRDRRFRIDVHTTCGGRWQSGQAITVSPGNCRQGCTDQSMGSFAEAEWQAATSA
jgi:hypothetical protein